MQKLLADIAASTGQGTVTARPDPNASDFMSTSDSAQLASLSDVASSTSTSPATTASGARPGTPRCRAPRHAEQRRSARLPGSPSPAGGRRTAGTSRVDPVHPRQNLVDQFVTGYSEVHRQLLHGQSPPRRFSGQPVGDQRASRSAWGPRRRRHASDLDDAAAGAAQPDHRCHRSSTRLRGTASYTMGGTFTHVGLSAFQPDAGADHRLRPRDGRPRD